MKGSSSAQLGAWMPYSGTDPSLRPKEVLVVYGSADSTMDLRMVVDEMSKSKLLTVDALVRARPAEPDMFGRQPGALIEVMAFEPTQGPGLHP